MNEKTAFISHEREKKDKGRTRTRADFKSAFSPYFFLTIFSISALDFSLFSELFRSTGNERRGQLKPPWPWSPGKAKEERDFSGSPVNDNVEMSPDHCNDSVWLQKVQKGQKVCLQFDTYAIRGDFGKCVTTRVKMF